VVASRQQGVVGWCQLRSLGFSEDEILGLVAREWLLRIHRGVYAVGHARLSAHGRWMAAVLACGDGARLSHGAAASLHDLWRIGGGPIHVTAAGPHQVSGVRCHTTRDVARMGHAVIDAIPVTSVERTVLDLAVDLSAQRLRTLLEEVERRNRFDLRRFDAELGACPGHHGSGRLRSALACMSDTPPELRSRLEGRFLELVRGAGLREPSANVIVEGELVDYHWPELRLIVEVDSWLYHRSRRSFEDDRRRTNHFGLAGQLPLRITDTRINEEPEAVARELARALDRRR
jgi:very-short-patch-repair endonuclease